MSKLFVDETVAIEAPIVKIWRVLTDPVFTAQWSSEFSGNGPQIHLESNWRKGSKVVWLDNDKHMVIKGKVTAVHSPDLLRFTVFDARVNKEFRAKKEDGIAFELSEHGGSGKTILHVLHGNFFAMRDGAKYHQASLETWERVLPKIKALAETG